MHSAPFAMRESRPGFPYASPVVEGAAGDVLHFGVLIESLNGGPSAAALALKFQIRPIHANGFSINAEVDAVGRPWIDVTAADGRLGHMLLDGDWPASLADQTYPARTTAQAYGTPFLYERRLRLGAYACQARVLATATMTGGSAPRWILSGVGAIQPRFG